ncbi:hypothetical protein DERF_008857 [Dermatophagoides farinae]|uniref:Uncharacterized protein n=1 Tax=Dermatophagoides farinae TaxID=6954 RepID=A0A922I5D2_DERFA|nr:hypothetical protein DERF_008857 [Dermatophagoides farinae]
MNNADNDVCSAGLTMTVLPAAKAGAAVFANINVGLFHGIMIAQTPNGIRMVIVIRSSPQAVGMVSPLILSTIPA